MRTIADIERELEAHKAITDYCATGICPPGVRPEVMEALADIVAAEPGSTVH